MRKILSFVLMMALLVCSPAWGADIKVSSLAATTTLTDNDLFLATTYSAGVFTSKKITVTSLKAIFQPYSSVLAIYAGITPSANVQTFLGSTSYSAMRTYLSLVPGTHVQTYDADLAAIAALACTENQIIKRSGAGTWICGSDNNDSGGYTNLTSFTGQTAWRVFYSDGSGDVTELALGEDGTYLRSNGASSAPTFSTPAGSGDFKADGTVPMSAAIIPDTANTIALGSSSAEWADIFLGDGAVIYGQNDSSNTITSSATGWIFAKPISISDGSNDNYLKITNNTSRPPTASINEIYPEGNIWKINQNGTESSIVIGPTAGQVTFTGPTQARSYAIGDAAGKTIAFTDSNITGSAATLASGGSGVNPRFLHGSSLSAGSSSGQIIAGLDLTIGSAYYMSSAGLALADASSASSLPAICIADTTTSCMYSGIYKFSATQSWTAGAQIYISATTAGALVTTAPSTAGQFVQKIGVALAADTILIMPSLDIGGI